MSNPAPLWFSWDAERSVMVPQRARLADRTYVDGEKYRLGVIEERSFSSHQHYFAALNEAWQNLSDEQLERWPTVEHLRKYALIKCGFCEERQLVFDARAEAERVASMVRSLDGYAVVQLKEKAVRVFTAKSQSWCAMGREDFQKSKQAVLDYVANLIGTTTGQLEQYAGAHA